MSFKVGQFLSRNDVFLIFIENDVVYKFNEGAPKTTLDLLKGCSGTYALSNKIESLKNIYGYKLFCENLDQLFKKECIAKPIFPPEVWAVGVTYKRQAMEHDEDLKKRKSESKGLYSYVYSSERAEVFFKGFNRTCVSSLSPLYLRADSSQTMPEAEMVIVLGEDSMPIGYTLGNDLTAWDIETESPLFLNQAKIWDGCSSIGPFIIPANQIPDPYNCHLICKVVRNGKTIINSIGETSELKRSLEELCYFLKLNNKVPCGSLLFTGTACIIPHDFALLENDKVIIEMEEIGQLRNTIIKHKKIERDYNTR